MKKLLQNKKVLAAIGGAVALVLIIAVYVTMQNKPPVPDPVPESSVSTPDTSVEIKFPENSETPEISGDNPTSDIPDDGSGLKPDESVSTDSGKTNTGEKAQNTTPPAKEADPPKNTDNNQGGGIQIGGGGDQAQDEQQAAAQAWLRNLELEGCPYCSSHSCPSFYAKDEWGNPSLDVTLCPKYDEHKDPIKYCPHSGKRTGDGTNGTCVRFVNDCYCPNCGKYVKANTCHTCDE